jgi:hypothetical protein
MYKLEGTNPKQREQDGRSAKRYNDLVKKTQLCQNRGGPVLAKAWCGSMVSGYMQDSCEIPDLDNYFFSREWTRNFKNNTVIPLEAWF